MKKLMISFFVTTICITNIAHSTNQKDPNTIDNHIITLEQNIEKQKASDQSQKNTDTIQQLIDLYKEVSKLYIEKIKLIEDGPQPCGVLDMLMERTDFVVKNENVLSEINNLENTKQALTRNTNSL